MRTAPLLCPLAGQARLSQHSGGRATGSSLDPTATRVWGRQEETSPRGLPGTEGRLVWPLWGREGDKAWARAHTCTCFLPHIALIPWCPKAEAVLCLRVPLKSEPRDRLLLNS